MAQSLDAWLAAASGGSGAPATSAEISALEDELGFSLYREHCLVLASRDRPEGFVGENYVAFWAPADILAQLPELSADCAGWVPFASNGGGEWYGYDSRRPGLPRIVMMPAIGPEWDDAIDLGATWTEFWDVLLRESC